MGQYYIPLLINDGGAISTLLSHEFGEGLKLREHSWIGNHFVNAVLCLLDNTPQRLAWIGDYSNDSPLCRRIRKGNEKAGIHALLQSGMGKPGCRTQNLAVHLHTGSA